MSEAVCARPCCGSRSGAMTMSDYIDAGLRRRRRPPLPVAGAERVDEDGRSARFTLSMRDGVIADAAFEASACVTLIAYCELLCRRIQGLTPVLAAHAIQPQTLAASLPLVPPLKQPRAMLAARALVAALTVASTSTADATNTTNAVNTASTARTEEHA